MNLSFDNISASYKKENILENVSFVVDDGSITFLTGRNGTGKSTLINCLMGEKSDYTGKILLGGTSIKQMPKSLLARKIACLPQNLPKPHITVKELVSFGRRPYTSAFGRLSKKDDEEIERAISSVNLTKKANSFVDTLSGGERKKAFFAMTLAQDTPLVVLDEPTAHLDTVSRFEFLKLISDMKQKTGKTFLVVMHDLAEVLRYADRIITFHNKTVVFDGTSEQCLAEAIPEKYFGIEIRKNENSGYAVSPLNPN